MIQVQSNRVGSYEEITINVKQDFTEKTRETWDAIPKEN